MRSAFLAALLAGAAAAQTVYQWTDETGETHYTDDRSTIPKNAKVRTTAGEELGIVRVGPPAKPAAALAHDAGLDAGAPDAGAPAKPLRNMCTEHRKRVDELEKALADAKHAADQYVEDQRAHCQKRLNLEGPAAYSACLTQPIARSPELDRQIPRVDERLQAAREDLRRAQVSGCMQ